MTTSKIFGIGCDVVKMSRLRHLYNRFGQRFLSRAYHPSEIDIFQALNDQGTGHHTTPTPQQVEFLASRWAIKEAATKAFSQHRIPFPEMYITKTKTTTTTTACASPFTSLVPFRTNATRPTLEFSPTVQSLCQHLTIDHIHVSLSHDDDYAYSCVVLETT